MLRQSRTPRATSKSCALSHIFHFCLGDAGKYWLASRLEFDNPHSYTSLFDSISSPRRNGSVFAHASITRSMPVILQSQEILDLGMGLFVFLTTLVLGGVLANSVFSGDQYECIDMRRSLAKAASDMSDDSGSASTTDEDSSTDGCDEASTASAEGNFASKEVATARSEKVTR